MIRPALTPYQRTLAHLRATCTECVEGTARPEYVSVLSWHQWGHSLDGAPPSGPGPCACGTALGNGPRFWHCGGCHETFAGERPFTRHRRGSNGDRRCLDVLRAAPSPYWEDAHGVWHYGPRDNRHAAPGTSGRTLEVTA